MFIFAKQTRISIPRFALFFSSIQQFTPDELKKSQKHVEETLRTRTWVTYMLASYLPVELRIHYYTINLFDMELTKIS